MEKGCLYRRPGRPTIYVKFRPRRGAKPIHLSTGKTNMIAAAREAEKIVARYEGRTPKEVKGQHITIGHFCRLPEKAKPNDHGGEFWQYLVANRAGTTRDRYHDVIRTQLIPAFGHLTFEQVEPEFLENWKQKRLKQVERATVLKELNCFSAVFRVARKVYRYTRYNPVTDIEKPTIPKRKKKIPTIEEIKEFLNAAAAFTPWYYPTFLTLYQGGLRIDEARHLEPADVDERDNVLRVRVKQGWHPKDQEDRDIPLEEPMRSVLLSLKGQRPDAKWLLPRHDKRLYFCRRCGRHETHIGRLRKTIVTLAEAAKIPVHVTHHMLRHCNSTHNRKMGATDYEVMELLGQQSTKVHSLYTHAQWQGIVEASKRLGQSIGSDGLSIWLSKAQMPIKP